MLLLSCALLLALLSPVRAGGAFQGSIGSSSRFDDFVESSSRFAHEVGEAVADCASSSSDTSDSSEPDEFQYDLSGWKLELLLDSPVYYAERVFRDLETDCRPLRKLEHSGVRVTIQEPRLEPDQVWLIHKGGNFGKNSKTVVVAARHMSNGWRVEKSRNFQGSKTVRQLRDAGGVDYNWHLKNCHFASKKMFDL